MIDPRRLRVLQAVATHGSVATAAEALHLTPPAVSQQLLALERETGASLIDRSGRQVTLTAAGRLLAGHGERIAAQLRQAERDLADLTGQVAGPVRLAAFQSVMGPLVAPALRILAADHPAVRRSSLSATGRLPSLTCAWATSGRRAYRVRRRQPAARRAGPRPAPSSPSTPTCWSSRQTGGSPSAACVTSPAGRGSPGRPAPRATTPCGGSRPRPASPSRTATSAWSSPPSWPWSAAGRGAAIIPRLALGHAPVTVCALPPLGGRHIAAWYLAGPARPAPATATVLDALAQAGQAPRQAP